MTKLFVALLLALLIGGCSGSGSTPVNLSAIKVTPPTASVSPGSNVSFRATGVFSDGNQVDLTGLVSWSSSDPTVATVDSSGVATGVGAGSSRITATSGTLSGSATLTTAAVLSIAVTPANPVGIVGGAQQFTATATLTNGAVQDLTGHALWNSSDPTVATINQAGLATPVGAGASTITASAGGASGQTTLTVATVLSLALAPATPSVDAGASQQFTATGTLSNGTVRDVTSLANWSSADASIVSISAAGVATALSLGATTISAALPGVTTRSTGIQVLGPTSIAVTPANASAVVGSTQQFTASGTFADGSTRDLTALVTWSSSSPGIATISNTVGSRGVATALGNGATIVTATLGVAGSASLTVKSLSSVTVTPAAPAISRGASQQFTATGSFSDGSTQDLTNSVAWSSSAPAIAAIGNTAGTKGLLTANALGRTTVTASFGAISGTSSVAVIVTNAAFVSDFGSNLLSVVDTGNTNLVSNVSVGSAPQGVAVDAANSRAYVANNGNNSVSVLDIAGNTQVTTVSVGAGPWGVALNQTARRLYVANSFSATVSVIDTGNNTVVATIPVGATPKGIAVNTASNRIYVANSGSNSVSVIDGTSNTVIGSVSVQQAPLEVAINPAANRAYVTNSNSGTVTVIDTASNLPITTIVVGSGPWGVALGPGASRLYVANNQSGTVSVIDTAINTLFFTIPVGSAPRGVAVNPTTNRVFVANFGSNTISVIDAVSESLINTIPGFIGPNEVAVVP